MDNHGTPRTPPAPYGYRLSLLLTWGERDQAEHLLEQLNKIQRAFGFPDYEMPEPASVGLPDLVIYPSGLPDLQLTECRPDPLRRFAA